MTFQIESCTKTGCLRYDGEVARVLLGFLAVVVYVFDVLIETEVELPLVG